MKKTILLLGVTVLLACQSEQKTKQIIDSSLDIAVVAPQHFLTAKYDSVKVYSKDPVSKEERVTDTAKAVIKYPVFPDEKVNAFLSKKILATADQEKYNSYKEYASGFIKGFDTFRRTNPDRIQTWFLDINATVGRETSNYISFYIKYINFSGGAHPNSVFLYANFNPVSHKEVVLESMLLSGGMQKLTEIAEHIFRKNENLSENESLKGKYFFKNDKFSLNNNFTITDDGLLFLYNPYEIKAYVFGTTPLLIPFSELQEIAKPNYLLVKTNK